MFHSFSDDALEVVYRSEVIENELGFPDLGTGGLLIGLIEESSSIVGIELRESGLNSLELRKKLMTHRKMDIRQEIEVFEACFKEKVEVCQKSLLVHREMGHSGTYSEHLFISMLRKRLSVVREILEFFGVNGDELCSKVTKKMAIEAKFQVRPPNEYVFQSTYMGVLVASTMEVKSTFLRQLAANRDDESERARLYGQTIQQLKAAHQNAPHLKLQIMT